MIQLDRYRVLSRICKDIGYNNLVKKYDKMHLIYGGDYKSYLIIGYNYILHKNYAANMSYLYSDEKGMYIIHKKSIYYKNMQNAGSIPKILKLDNITIYNGLTVRIGDEYHNDVDDVKITKVNDEIMVHIKKWFKWYTFNKKSEQVECVCQWLIPKGNNEYKIIGTDISIYNDYIHDNMFEYYHKGYLFLYDIIYPENNICYGLITIDNLYLIAKELKEKIIFIILILKNIKLEKIWKYYLPMNLLIYNIITLIT